jgi:cobalt/nickel transport system permease protein
LLAKNFMREMTASIDLNCLLLQPYLAMHIPDGYLSLPVSGICWILAIALIALGLNRVRSEYQERAVPLMGVCAAFIFAAQMINFPIPGGTSGHLLGGTLAGVLLGPWAGSLVMAVVFIVQATLFQDGGLTVLGSQHCQHGIGRYVLRLLPLQSNSQCAGL